MSASPSPLPVGFRIQVDPHTEIHGDRLIGGSPGIAIRLSEPGLEIWNSLQVRPITTRAAGVMARRLTDAGLAHPVPPAGHACPDLTVVIPAFGRADHLERCLRALGGVHPTLVVDDASPDAAQISATAARHGARVVRHDRNRGPAAARNTGLALVETELVAFIDSDCVPNPGVFAALTPHLLDPMVAAVAPRIRPLGSAASVAPGRGYTCLDLGHRPGRVTRGGAVPYVPTAAIVARVAALRDIGGSTGVFDDTMRVGEDVDLVWRLDAAGWRVRYAPGVVVCHEEPARWSRIMRRRFHYGTSAAPLARRYPGALAPVTLRPFPALAVAGALLRRPGLTVAGVAATIASTARMVDSLGLSRNAIAPLAARQLGDAAARAGRAATQFGAPLLALAVCARARRRGRRVVIAALVAAPYTVARLRRDAEPVPVTAGIDEAIQDVAYGAGVLYASACERQLGIVVPRISPLNFGHHRGVSHPSSTHPGATHVQ